MKKVVLFSLLFFTIAGLSAQNPVVLFEETFDDGLGSFTQGASDPDGAVWQHAPTGRADTIIVDGEKVPAAFYGQASPVLSPTGETGAVQFNSDAYDNGGDPNGIGDGPYPSPQTSMLVSPIIDCSGHMNVALEFYQYARTLFDDNTVVQVSGDGGQNWTDFNPNEELLSNEVNENTSPDSRIVIDISEVAGGSANVQVRFVWDGDYYFWLIDDVRVLGSVENNLAVSDYFYPLSSYATPASQIATDTFGFFASVSNLGIADQSNVVVKATVFTIDNDGNTTDLFSDSTELATLPAGYMDSLVTIDMTYAPELDQGAYGIIYETYSDGGPDDFYENDNIDGEVFIITENIFSKDDGFLGPDREWPSGFTITGDYQMGNVYTMSSLSGGDYVATEATFRAFRPGSEGSIEGNTTTILLYRVKDRVDPLFNNFNVNSTGGTEEDDDLELVGFGSYTFPADFDAFEDITIDLESFDNPGSPVPLDPGARYFLVADYQGDANKIIHQVSNDIRYAAGIVSSLVFADGSWGGLGRGNQPIMRMTIQMVTDRDEVPLPENALSLFPNPASDLLSVQLDLEEVGDAMVTIADISGRILRMRQYNQVQRETLNFDVSSYPAGTYLLRIGTANGTSTKKFVISR